MQTIRLTAAIVGIALAWTTITFAGPGGPPRGVPGGPPKIKVHKAGEFFCPAGILIINNVVILGGRCYVVFVMRNSGGTFLAFGDPAVRIPPGQIVRLGTPAGAKARGRIFHLVPVSPSVALVPMNSIMLVAFEARDEGSKMSLTLVGTGSNLTVVFSVRL